ncbi:hypothetical protein E2562_000787 [Oryza meyeriana var. granulata]|uniref:Uncharacterized protein n=1 Tax=Oryza meyeriana var. granulata TaxID=110450 RepID=A0A6G1DTN2_9ORYZ|nr:hypothetical protein E2562_000787 [Oryza meyeriana var. granulata]
MAVKSRRMYLDERGDSTLLDEKENDRRSELEDPRNGAVEVMRTLLTLGAKPLPSDSRMDKDVAEFCAGLIHAYTQLWLHVRVFEDLECQAFLREKQPHSTHAEAKEFCLGNKHYITLASNQSMNLKKSTQCS